MTDFSKGFKREVREQIDWSGVHAFKIIDVVESVSQTSGLPMIVVKTEQSKSGIICFKYIVQNDYFNQNMTELFNALDEVEFGDFDFTHWVGKCGVARYRKGDRGYVEISRFLPADGNDAMECEPFFEKPAKEEDSGSEDLPF